MQQKQKLDVDSRVAGSQNYEIYDVSYETDED